MHSPLGAVACISPWNFPLAIFIEQVMVSPAPGRRPAERSTCGGCWPPAPPIRCCRRWRQGC
jgi:hypothetical protein